MTTRTRGHIDRIDGRIKRMIKESQRKYNAKHIKRVPLDMQIEEYEKIKELADVQGIGVNTFIKNLLKQSIEREES